jgi:hypothetical protein
VIATSGAQSWSSSQATSAGFDAKGRVVGGIWKGLEV